MIMKANELKMIMKYLHERKQDWEMRELDVQVWD